MEYKTFSRCHFLPVSHMEHVPQDAVAINVSSYAEDPYCSLSPFYAHGDIPIPGLKGKTSDTVEGIWQGLKVIRGKTAPRYFHGAGRKRGGKPAGHFYGKKDRLLGIVEARYKIYRVAYYWVLENRIDPCLIEELVERAFTGISQYFYDVEDNGDINNAHLPLAHASLVAQYINSRCTQLLKR